jgi:enoyl-CoA hydratase
VFGESLDGEEAARRQLAWRCVPESELLEVAYELAAVAAGRDRALLALTRRTLDDSTTLQHASDAIALELERQQWSMRRPEFAEALGRLRARLGRSEGSGRA